ncbi:unnamed protein product [Rotaria magnacalcarata]|uniref:SCP domain-containing protein n=1 Tax=Rotaria magnacalcarata TaxID=392030 RepID=A0A8S3AR04_9BILA|nr:unnamed protein product [Rotaria magnacalcarata]
MAYAFTAEQKKYQEDSLKHHNTLRARHCAAALQLDDILNKIAQDYANLLASKILFQHSNNGFGENLYMMSSSVPINNFAVTAAIQSWYDEIKDYDYNQPQFSMETGHFTQVVWKNSQKLGVGVGFSADKRRAYVVANYNPAGNSMGEYSQ